MNWRESTQYSSDPAFWDKGIEIIVLKEMQGRSSQATRDFDVCYVFNLKIWLRTSIGSASISKDDLLQSPEMLFIRKAEQRALTFDCTGEQSYQYGLK